MICPGPLCLSEGFSERTVGGELRELSEERGQGVSVYAQDTSNPLGISLRLRAICRNLDGIGQRTGLGLGLIGPLAADGLARLDAGGVTLWRKYERPCEVLTK